MRKVPGTERERSWPSTDRCISGRNFEEAIDNVKGLVFMKVLVKGYAFTCGGFNEYPGRGASSLLASAFDVEGLVKIPIPLLVRRGLGARQHRVCDGSRTKWSGKERLVDKIASRGHCHKSFLLTP